jgi:CubicO group peptidase (beta-lactamase class C family)
MDDTTGAATFSSGTTSHGQIISMIKNIAALLFIFVSLPSFSQLHSVAALTDSITKIMEKEHIPGLSIALVHRDSIIWQGGVGVADRATNRPVTQTDLFRIGSITKTFISLAIQRLIAEGKFSLDSKLKTLTPEVPFENAWEGEEPIRVVHLLEHTAGFDDMHLNVLINDTGKKMPALEEVLTHKKSLHARWKPGTRHAYSNPGYMILGLLIEKYSGMPYEDYVFQQVILPLKMTHTNFDYSLARPYSKGYSYDGAYHEARAVMINGRAAGAICSSAEDMARYVRMFLNNGQLDGVQIVSAATLNDMERQHSTLKASNGLTCGYGLGLSTKLSGGVKNKKHFFGHDGGIMGFGSDLNYSRELGVGFFISNNGETGNHKITDLIAEFLDRRASVLPPVKKLDKEMIKPWLGCYKGHNSRNEILRFVDDLVSSRNLFIENDTLFTGAFLHKKEALIPVGEFQFRKYNQPIATAILVKDMGKPVLFVNEGYFEKISPVTYNLQRAIVFGAIFLGGIAIILSAVWTVLFLMKRIRGRELVSRCISTFAVLSFLLIVTPFVLSFDLKNIQRFSSMNGWTLTIFVGSILFPLLSFWSLYRSVRLWKFRKSVMLKSFLIVTSVCLSCFAIYLAEYGWFAIRIWSY